MSQMRHDAGIDVRSDAVTYPAGTVLGTYIAPGWDRLLHAVSGVMSVETEAGIWVVPPHRALWVPDGHDYRVQMHGRVAVRNLYLRYELAARVGYATPSAFASIFKAQLGGTPAGYFAERDVTS